MKYLQSGLRRDVCIVVYSLGAPTGQQAKRELQDHYDEHLSPERFYGAVESLVELGHLAESRDGIQDRYELTDAGQRALLAHAEWVEQSLEE